MEDNGASAPPIGSFFDQLCQSFSACIPISQLWKFEIQLVDDVAPYQVMQSDVDLPVAGSLQAILDLSPSVAIVLEIIPTSASPLCTPAKKAQGSKTEPLYVCNVAIEKSVFKMECRTAQQIFLQEPQNVSLDVSALILLMMPSNEHLWGQRRQRILETSFSDRSPVELVSTMHWDIRKELLFVALVLSMHPKIAQVWHQHQWVISLWLQIDQKGKAKNIVVEENYLQQFLQFEYSFIESSLMKHARNYQAWVHRNFIWEIFVNSCPDRIQYDFSVVLKWFSLNVSDASAVHYLLEVMRFLLHAEEKKMRDLLDVLWHSAFMESQRLLNRHADQGHESIWLFRRGLVSLQDWHPTTACEKATLRGIDFIFSRGWTLWDEVDYVWAHVDPPWDMTAVHASRCICAKALEDCGGTSPRWNAFYAAKYGMWIMQFMAAKAFGATK